MIIWFKINIYKTDKNDSKIINCKTDKNDSKNNKYKTDKNDSKVYILQL